MLADYCGDAADKAALYALCCPSGAAAFEKLQATRPSLLELLNLYPSCKPKLDHILDLLSPLLPRSYSVTSSALSHPTSVHIAFTVVEYQVPTGTISGSDSDSNSVAKDEFRARKGLCTSWLHRLCLAAGFLKDHAAKPSPALCSTSDDQSDMEAKACEDAASAERPLIDALVSSGPIPGCSRSADGLLSIPVFIRKARSFCLPDTPSRAIIMVGPGTGCAPFRGFLQQRRCQIAARRHGGVCDGAWRGLELPHAGVEEGIETDDDEELDDRCSKPSPKNARVRSIGANGSGTAANLGLPGPALLFYGCRREDEDFLYANDFQTFVRDRTLTALHTAFSREQQHKVYVQHRLREQGEHVCRLILKENAIFYVCGDGNKMARDVQNTVQELLQKYAGLSADDARQYIEKMKTELRYLQDIWS
jgi:sulfite reductase alpha subunit-like flavoprotein